MVRVYPSSTRHEILTILDYGLRLVNPEACAMGNAGSGGGMVHKVGPGSLGHNLPNLFLAHAVEEHSVMMGVNVKAPVTRESDRGNVKFLGEVQTQ